MLIRLAIIVAYLLLMLAIGLLFRKVSSRSTVEFFLAGRGIPHILLFCTMAATNFSAFTIFGLSGAGYRIGYAFYPVMAFGTGFMALAFITMGSRIRALSAGRGWITPAHFMAERYGSPLVARLFSLVLIVLTLPYISLQGMASGRSLQTLAGLPYWAGAFLVTAFSVLYVALGGMRSDVWTDVVQGVMMILLTGAAFIIIATRAGGFIQANLRAFQAEPALFSRPGADGSLVIGVWIGYMLLWLFADPMFPQIFQRFMAARDDRSLAATAVLYPLVTALLFFLTVSIGVMGRAAIPGLPPAASDTILPLLLEKSVGGVLAAVLLTGGMAALMSTLDSQLLSLSSMISLDFLGPRRGGGEPRAGVLAQRLIVCAIGAAGFLIALRPPGNILDFINRASFTGFAALAPAVLAGLYWRRATAAGAAASIICGEAAVLVSGLGILRVPGVLPVIPVLAISAAAMVLGSILGRGERVARGRAAAQGAGAAPGGTDGGGSGVSAPGGAAIAAPPGRLSLRWAGVFLALLALSVDFWAWGRKPVIILGLPVWMWYSMGLCLAASGAFWLYAAKKFAPEAGKALEKKSSS
jgi:solute:Na+ symporter, SSS family